MRAKLETAVLIETVRAVIENGSQRKTAKAIGISQAALCWRLAEAKKRGLYQPHVGRVEKYQSKKMPLPAKGQYQTYLLTCAQNGTKLHKAVWANLQALAQHDKAKILVSTLKYNKNALGQRAAAKYESREAELAAEYDPELIPYVCDDRIELAPALVFCGELNIMPTATDPLSGMETYTYRQSTIVPHPRLAMTSVPTMKSEGVKLMYTTGSVTQRNYIKRKEGFRADHFHSYGALLVTVQHDGSFHCRQLQLGPDNAIYDLDRCVKNGKVTTGHRVADVTIEVHAQKMDPEIADLTFGTRKDSLWEVLRPESTHVHDLLDFGGRSHHTRKDPHEVYKSYVEGRWVASNELTLTADVLWQRILRPWLNVFIVNSNHDRHLEIWLKQVDWRNDPANAELLLALNLEWVRAIKRGDKINMAELALREAAKQLPNAGSERITFLKEDESHVILKDIAGGIECGLHGDRGANGAKGTLTGIAKTDRATNMGDKHVVGIRNHTFCTGFIGYLDQGYNHGLSSWTNAVTVTYPNATRTIISFWKGKWRA